MRWWTRIGLWTALFVFTAAPSGVRAQSSDAGTEAASDAADASADDAAEGEGGNENENGNGSGNGDGDGNGNGDGDGNENENGDGDGDGNGDGDGDGDGNGDEGEAGTPAASIVDEASPEETLATAQQNAVNREAREGRFVGDVQDAAPTASVDDLPAGDDEAMVDLLSDAAVYDLTWQIAPGAWLRPEGLLQLRYTTNYRDSPATGREATIAFTIPRGRIMLWAGATEYLRFRMRFGVNSGGDLSLEQAFADAALGPVTLRVGRFWLPIYWGGGFVANFLTKTDYSFASNYLDGGQTQGLSLAWGQNRARVRLFLNDGLRTGFSEFGEEVGADIALSGRVDARLFTEHTWDRFDEPSSFPGSDIALRVGAAAHAQRGGGTGDTANLDYLIVTTDVQLEGDGFHLFFAGGWVHVRLGDVADFNNFALEAQAGYFVLDPLELWVAYDGLFADGEPQPPGLGGGTGETDLHTVSAGLTWFIIPRAHRAKLQAQFDYVFGPVSTSLIGPSNNNGLLATTEGNQWIARLQLTLAF